MVCKMLVGASFDLKLTSNFKSVSIRCHHVSQRHSAKGLIVQLHSQLNSCTHAAITNVDPDTSRSGAAPPRHVESGLPDGRQRGGGPQVSISVAGQEAGQKEEAIRPAHQHFVIGLGWLGIEGGKRQQRGCRLEQASPCLSLIHI